jgi:hypothetical protein
VVALGYRPHAAQLKAIAARSRKRSTCEDSHGWRGKRAPGPASSLKNAGPLPKRSLSKLDHERRVSRMSAKPPSRQAQSVLDRGAAAGAQPKRGSLRWVRNVLSRSLNLQQGRNASAAASADAMPGAAAEPSPLLLTQQRAELGARLLVHDPTTQVVRHLFVVHDQLQTQGWPGVEALPAKVLDRALTEAEILASDEPSALLTTIIDQLRELKAGAALRALEEELEREFETLQVPEVSDTNFDEYELMERSWAGTVPAGLELPSRTL